MSFVARRYGISTSLLLSRKRRMLEGGDQAVHASEEVGGTSGARRSDARATSNACWGRETMEAEILTDALDLTRMKGRPRRSAPGAVRHAVRGQGAGRHARRGPLPRQGGSADGRRARPAAAVHTGSLAQSNGTAEAFVKTLERDYARLAILTDVETLVRQLPAWFEDDATIHSLTGLRLLSPPRMPQPPRLNPPHRLSDQTGCTPAGEVLRCSAAVSRRGFPRVFPPCFCVGCSRLVRRTS